MNFVPVFVQLIKLYYYIIFGIESSNLNGRLIIIAFCDSKPNFVP